MHHPSVALDDTERTVAFMASLAAERLVRSKAEAVSEAAAFASQAVELLDEFGATEDLEPIGLYLPGPVSMAVNGGGVAGADARVDLLVSHLVGDATLRRLPKQEVLQRVKAALRTVAHLRARPLVAERLTGEVRDLASAIANTPWTTVRVFFVTDGECPELTAPTGVRGIASDVAVELHVWDASRLARAALSGKSSESVDVDLRPGLPCLLAVGSEAPSYLVILPGELLARLYDDLGERLLELNVRSFLQARGKVNKGIRETLLGEPGRFFAYNNGLTAIAQSIEVDQNAGTPRIIAARGLQIVNGGQTTASIHRAWKRDRADLTKVAVPMKLTVLAGDAGDELAGKISHHANSQNRVTDADFSANDPFHQALEQLSRTIWAPGERTRWFYERARGQYQVARAAAGTPAGVRAFDEANPAHQVFAKTDLAASEHCWAALPHVVSRGAQKNFREFMLRRTGIPKSIDASYYKHTVARLIVHRAARRAAVHAGVSAYRVNIVAFTLALVSHHLGERIDLDRIWAAQAASAGLEDVFRAAFLSVDRTIKRTGSGKNLGEWCKQRDCWDAVRQLPLDLPEEPVAELR
jgi:hypothetical protein